MNKELALRTFGYLIRHYKTHNETTINKQEIEAIEFMLKINEELEQQCKKQKEIINEAIKKVDILRRNYAENVCQIPCTEIEDIDGTLKEVSE